MYERLKPWLFRQDPETIHDRAMGGLAWLARRGPLLGLLQRLLRLDDPRLEVRAFGLRFPNPIGLAAGFDKNALALRAWPALGFGFVEIGSITALPQPGNPKPRLFRLPEAEALINRMGFNNEGAEAVARRLAAWQAHGPLPVPLGINLGKSRATPLEKAAEDYLKSLSLLLPYGDYFVLNVSSPNTPGLRALQEKERLEALLQALTGYLQGRKPLLLKLAPDLTWAELDDILELSERYGLAGLIATNTTVQREGLPLAEEGGLSGRPLARRALEVLRYLHKRLQGRLPIVSVGGIFSPEDVWERLEQGACLVQIYTGFVYQGPLLPRRLCQGLLARLEAEGRGLT
ncbi:quinone-dependent dihydroorotate dehydrogenase [Meiothermus sp. QL-1]|uniref:quinone-dependent dihydroorotate dehydrogenase n=1 Tax=Meiothermus sp. QL-1 TaxID=2058095 RepID=UPI000E0A2C41|nr:quinone-dependent dihydroorotate dehydrogenase [Meiothermus sp. QL-1]RDI95898.1 quinone-dependent dihydroorotate dehydrogenase [Meiothermus sp. QL-1]